MKGENSGWENQPRVALNIRYPNEVFKLRAENEWPLARTSWTKFYLQPGVMGLDTAISNTTSTMEYDPEGEGYIFMTSAMKEDMEVTGPIASKIWLSSEMTDADVILALRLYDPAGKEVVFIGSNDPRTPIGLGWLRASHRKLDPIETKPYRPWHTHDEEWPLTPNEPVEMDIEIWPTSFVVPKGYRLGLNIRGSDYEVDGKDAGVAHAPYQMKGVGPFTHTNLNDRPPEVFGGKHKLHFSSEKMPFVLLPVIPS